VHVRESQVVKNSDRVFELLGSAKSIAQEYYSLTGRPLGITGEVAEFEAARLLGLELATVRQAGYDATRRLQNGAVERLQIKGRRVTSESSASQRLGSIEVLAEWDAVLMVLLDSAFDAFEIHEARRPEIEAALSAPGSVARNERGALPVAKFKSIGKLVWRRSARGAI
jgi:hypothetical protein